MKLLLHFQKISKTDIKKIHATDRAGMSALHCAVAVGSVSTIFT